MDNTYRQIFKWGDKREEEIKPIMIKILHDKLNIQISDKEEKYLSGFQTVRLDKVSGLKRDNCNQLIEIVGDENILTDDFSRARFSCGKFYGELLDLRLGCVPNPPDAVVIPGNYNELIRIIELCNREKIPVIPSGGQSSVTGALQAPAGGIALDMTRYLNKVLNINVINQTVTAEAGIYGPELEKDLNRHGYSCGHFPQSFEYSTVGGWISAKGAGHDSTGYGKIEDMVVSLKVVTPAGVIETRDYPRTAQGWDIFRLFIGAEGTLGVIAEATLKIHRFNPANITYGSFIFRSFSQSTEAMRAIMQSGYGKPHLFRISDPDETEIAFRTSGSDKSYGDLFLQRLGFKSGKRCLMFAAVEGDKAYTRFVMNKIKGTARRMKGMYIGRGPVQKWLDQRYSSAYLRDPLMDMGIMTDTIETAVTWDKLMDVWFATHEFAGRRDNTVLMTHISHVYENGANLYLTFLSPMQRGNEKHDYTDFHRGLIDTIQEHGGSLSHHHGVGRVLAPWMENHLGKTSMDVLRAVKNHFDPKNIMNPGGMLGLK